MNGQESSQAIVFFSAIRPSRTGKKEMESTKKFLRDSPKGNLLDASIYFSAYDGVSVTSPR